MPGKSYTGALLELTPDEQQLVENLKKHVNYLADTIGERNYLSIDALDKAAVYIEQAFTESGYFPQLELFGNSEKKYKNIVAENYGLDKAYEVLIIGAHYDTVWLTSGADDNASGVAALLEIARLLSKERFSRSIRFVAFPNEEEPMYFTDEMGSLVYADSLAEKGKQITGMISLEMLGYYSDEADSQHYPYPIRYFYPDTASFIAFIGNLSSRMFIHDAIRSFRQNIQFPSEGLAAPIGLIPDIGRSDQISFWRHGVRGFMITDTGDYRNPNYHSVADVPSTLDYERMARVVMGISRMVAELANQ